MGGWCVCDERSKLGWGEGRRGLRRSWGISHTPAVHPILDGQKEFWAPAPMELQKPNPGTSLACFFFGILLVAWGQ